jgi:hypothetical protein
MNQPYYQPPQAMNGPSATQINPQYLQPNLPHQVCFIPQLQVLPHVAQVLPAMVGQIMLDLQNHAQIGPHRTYFFNLMSENAYQNKNFHELMSFAADLFDLYVTAHRMAHQQAFEMAVDRAIQIFLGSRVLQNPQVASYLNPQMVGDFQLLIQEGRNLAQEIANLRNQRMVPQGGYNYNGVPNGAPNNNYTPYQPGAMAYATSTTPNRPSALSAAAPTTMAPAPYLNQGQFVQSAPAPGPTRYEMGAVSPSGAMPVQAVYNLPPNAVGTVQVPRQDISAPTPTPAPQAGRSRWGKQSGEATAAPTQPAAPVVAPKVSTVPDPIIRDGQSTLAYDERPLDLIVTERGEEIAPAHLVKDDPGWQFRPTVNNPYRLAYDPNEYMLTLVRTPLGEVNEVLIEWTEAMDYLKHELNPELREQEQQRRDVNRTDKPIYDWSVIAALRPAASKSVSLPPKDEEQAAGLPDDPNLRDVPTFTPEVGQVRLAGTLAQGISDVDKMLRLEGRGGITRDTYEAYFDIPSVFVLPDQQWRDQLIALGSALSFDDLHVQFSQFMELDDPDVVRELDERITKVVNAAVREGLGVTCRIDSFLGDWPDLRAVLVERYAGTEYVDKLNDVAEELIGGVFNVMDVSQTSDYLASLGYAAEVEEEQTDTTEEVLDVLPEAAEVPDVAPETPEEEEVQYVFTNVAVLVDRVSVTTLPISRAEMSLNLESGNLVVEQYQPTLYQAISAIRERTIDHPCVYAHRYLLTNDRQLLELVTGIANRSALLLFDRGTLN